MTFQDALQYIYSFATYEIIPATAAVPKNLKLERMPHLLAALGNPHHRFQSVHIAGTKGKGSTAAMTESILRAAGYRTGLYTSPHLHTFCERIQVAGKMISRDEVVAGVAKLKPIVAEFPNITTFEIITALAFDHFATHAVDFAVIEVGLGGRLDATNVVTPRVAVITSISYDHTAILGDTLTKIAREKAGIIKPGIPVVSAAQNEEARLVIEATAHERGALYVQVTQDNLFRAANMTHRIAADSQTLDGQRIVWSRVEQADALDLRLLGRHQIANATTVLAAIAMLREQGIAISDDAIREGFANVQWQGRFEILSRDPCVILDGAHNADSAHQLVATLRDFFPRAGLHFVFGSSNDKDIAGMLTELLPHAASFTITRSHSARAADPGQIAQLCAQSGVRAMLAPDPITALQLAQEQARPGDVVCATGSLFVVAEVRAAWFAARGTPVESDDV
ncbi:MAG: bifunctional folylpolyglutamate synthase/dihydrofolate synthase [Chloroflexi bacterium]|nr:bifunctional folylpolyglutamate synthase/dihydrofolate synthase [Chloroflexota bacterium]